MTKCPSFFLREHLIYLFVLQSGFYAQPPHLYQTPTFIVCLFFKELTSTYATKLQLRSTNKSLCLSAAEKRDYEAFQTSWQALISTNTNSQKNTAFRTLPATPMLGWVVSTDTVPHTDFVLDALYDRQPAQASGLIHHSNRGSQYVSIRYTELLAEAGIKPSVGSRGYSYDNALAKTINGLSKAEVILSNWLRWNGCRGLITTDCSNLSVTSHP